MQLINKINKIENTCGFSVFKMKKKPNFGLFDHVKCKRCLHSFLATPLEHSMAI